ncbi:MAG: S-layer homology domain-containing protein [Evtepia sp.]
MKKRVISLLLAAVMLTALLPAAGAASVQDRPNVLGSLSAASQTALYDDLLRPLTAACEGYRINLDSRTSTDQDFLTILSFTILMGNPYFKRYNPINDTEYRCHMVYSQADFTRLTQAVFGRTVDYAALTKTSKPGIYTYSSFLWQGNFYLFIPQMGYIEQDTMKGQTLVRLSEDLYYTEYHYYNSQPYNNIYNQYMGTYGAVVKRNADGTWTLVKICPPGSLPSWDSLTAYAAPSSWAAGEVSAAQRLGLVPDLSGNPLWQDSASRLHFAQVAVTLAEKALGRTLPDPGTPFTDCNDAAVRKAYAAGIVNGTSDTTFSPNSSLTREQLATMLWRTIQYIQQETGRTVMTPAGSLAGFSDAAQVSDWARQAVAALNKYGIMKGTSDTTLSPRNSCTVEQSVLLSYRTFGVL